MMHNSKKGVMLSLSKHGGMASTRTLRQAQADNAFDQTYEVFKTS
jgi:hypothetical protein